MTGYIVRVVVDKQFGFIKAADGNDYFFHKSDLDGFWEDLVTDFDGHRNIKVTFEPTQGPKGLRAASVVRVDGGV